MDREFKDRIERLFATCGVTDFHFQNGGKHPLLIARHGDAYIRYAIPSTGSDRRGVANCVAFLRRALDLHPREEKRAPAPRRTRCAVKRSWAPLASATALVAVATMPTWQEVLAAHFGAARGGDGAGC
jgi:hypothetical protein